MKRSNNKPMLSGVSRVMYGIGSLGFGVKQHAVSGLVMFYAVAAHNLPATLAGLICAVAMLVAATTEPIAGNISDRLTSRLLGKRLGFILGGAFVLALVNVFIWSMPTSLPTWLKFFWLFFGVLAFEATNSFTYAPYSRLAKELAGSKQERAILYRNRYACIILGLLLGAAFMGVFLHGGLNTAEYRNMANVVSMLIIICGISVFFGGYFHIPRLNAKAGEVAPRRTLRNVWQGYFSFLCGKRLRNLTIGYAASFMSIAYLMSIGLFYFIYTAGLDFVAIAGLIGIVFLLVILLEPFWRKRANHGDKRALLIASMIIMLLGSLVFALMFVLGFYGEKFALDEFWVYIPSVALFGIGAGGIFTVPRLMFKDFKSDGAAGHVFVNEYMTMSYKLAASLTALVVGVALDIARFSSTKTMSEATLSALAWILIAGLLCSTIAAFVLYCRSSETIKKEK